MLSIPGRSKARKRVEPVWRWAVGPVAPEVVMLRVLGVEAVPPTNALPGTKVHVESAGRLEQESVTYPEKPLMGVSVMMVVTALPCGTLSDVEAATTLKSATPVASAVTWVSDEREPASSLVPA